MKLHFWGLGLVWTLASCTPEPAAPPPPAPDYDFALLTGAETGLDFTNQPTLSRAFNVFNYMYFYNGGGTAAADFNGDGRTDLFFTSNQDDNALFLNEGGLRFREVTTAAGLAGQPGWATGASVVDINDDGRPDLYVSQVSGYLDLGGHNQLYVNQGNDAAGVPRFTEEAAAYGLDLIGFGTQAAFFDYDGDGDLDLYQLNHSLHQNGTFGRRAAFGERHPLAGDRLLRNDGNGRFTDVSEAAGIRGGAVGYGLGVVTADLNADGRPDLYVANDFHENDYLYLNQGDGTFREALTEQMAHTSRFSMGVDAADLNNDGHPEVVSLDMLPEDPVILKSSLGEDGYDIFRFKLGHGYNPQFSRNSLQLNNGDGTFSEIAAFAGVHATDWSWAPLLFDIDHDGYRDLFISNGIPRRMNDIDYINFKTNDELKYREQFNDIRDRELAMVERMPEIKLPNKFYRNTGDLRFRDRSAAVRGAAPSYSSSAVYADLDNDGDLDVVTNNIGDAPFVYRNLLVEEGGGAAGAALIVQPHGPPGNRWAVGATAIAYAGQRRLRYEHYPTRGYQSSSLGPLHLGLGDPATVDSVLLVWPDGSYERLTDLRYDVITEVNWRPGLPRYDWARLAAPPAAAPLPLADVTAAAGLAHRHVENPFVDFNRETLIPHRISAEGPALATGDVDGDGLADFFVGSAKRRRSALYRQTAAGTFVDVTPPALARDSVFEDVDALLVDLDGDGDRDLVVAAGGNEYAKRQEPRRQRTYVNLGGGEWARRDLLPEIYLTASTVAAGDYDGDGDADLFLGGRVVPYRYGEIPPSYLLRNEGGGRFTDVTAEVAPELLTAGLVTDAEWADADGDGDADLFLTAEWQPVTVYLNQAGLLRPRPLGPQTGWWTHLCVGDFDGDGDTDVLAGNFGTNGKLQPTPEQPLRLYLADFDDNETLDQILTYYIGGTEVPFANHAELTKQLPGLRKDYLYAQDLARADLPTLFGRDRLAAATQYSATTLAHHLYLRQDDGSYRALPLPDVAQFSTLRASALLPEPNADGGRSLLFGGNFTGSNIEMGWYDAGRLRALEVGADGSMRIREVNGPPVLGEIRQLAPLGLGGGWGVLIGRNDAPLQLRRWSGAATGGSS